MKKEDFCPIPEKFKNRIYSIESFAPSIRDNPFVECGIFGYSVYFNKSNTFAVIVCYAGLAFVTEFVPDSNRLLIMHMGRSAPPLCRRLAQKAELKNELVTQYTEMLTRYKEVMTPELREKISAFYKKKWQSLLARRKCIGEDFLGCHFIKQVDHFKDWPGLQLYFHWCPCSGRMWLRYFSGLKRVDTLQ